MTLVYNGKILDVKRQNFLTHHKTLYSIPGTKASVMVYDHCLSAAQIRAELVRCLEERGQS
jgi:hypothetical protein